MKLDEETKTEGVEIMAQGSLLTVKPYRNLALFDNNATTSRGDVSEFSSKSRKRLLELVARLETGSRNGYRSNTTFLTLTTKKIYHPADFKPLMFTWLKRLSRKAPQMSGVWRIEYQKRGATHAHMILFDAPYINKEWIQESWGEVISQDKPFTRIERVRNHKAVINYASKYIAKSGGFINVPYLTADQETGEIRSIGRQWGVYNRACLPYAEATIIEVPLDGSYWLMRLYCSNLWHGLDAEGAHGFTIFCDNPLEHLKSLQTTSKQFIVASGNKRS